MAAALLTRFPEEGIGHHAGIRKADVLGAAAHLRALKIEEAKVAAEGNDMRDYVVAKTNRGAQ
ncbi:MAG: hypothetical protein WBY94_07505 [Polyangiaceae bacterium]